MRECAEDELGATQGGVICRNEREFATAKKRTFPSLGVRGRERQVEVRMAPKETAELSARIPTRAEHTNGDLMHAECILLHGAAVKSFRISGVRPTALAASTVTSRASSHTPVNVSKRKRQQAIRELIASRVVGSQEELRLLLRDAGWEVTQSTLSRDLRELRIARLPTPEGPRYVTPEALGAESEDRTLVEEVLPQFFSSLDGVSELLVLKTIYGGAQPVAEAIDDAGWDEVVGTIGGENTILIICRSPKDREAVATRLRRIAEG